MSSKLRRVFLVRIVESIKRRRLPPVIKHTHTIHPNRPSVPISTSYEPGDAPKRIPRRSFIQARVSTSKLQRLQESNWQTKVQPRVSTHLLRAYIQTETNYGVIFPSARAEYPSENNLKEPSIREALPLFHEGPLTSCTLSMAEHTPQWAPIKENAYLTSTRQCHRRSQGQAQASDEDHQFTKKITFTRSHTLIQSSNDADTPANHAKAKNSGRAARYTGQSFKVQTMRIY
jgi:hypothetical protein